MRLASRPLTSAQPASIKTDSPAGVTISVAAPPSTSMKYISNVRRTGFVSCTEKLLTELTKSNRAENIILLLTVLSFPFFLPDRGCHKLFLNTSLAAIFAYSRSSVQSSIARPYCVPVRLFETTIYFTLEARSFAAGRISVVGRDAQIVKKKSQYVSRDLDILGRVTCTVA